MHSMTSAVPDADTRKSFAGAPVAARSAAPGASTPLGEPVAEGEGGGAPAENCALGEGEGVLGGLAPCEGAPVSEGGASVPLTVWGGACVTAGEAVVEPDGVTLRETVEEGEGVPGGLAPGAALLLCEGAPVFEGGASVPLAV